MSKDKELAGSVDPAVGMTSLAGMAEALVEAGPGRWGRPHR